MIKDILYFQQNTAFDMIESYICTLARELDRSIFKVHVMYPDVPELRPFEPLGRDGVCLYSLLARLNVGIIVRSLPRSLNMFRQLKQTCSTVAYLLQNPQLVREMGKAGQVCAHAEFDISCMVSGINALFGGLCRGVRLIGDNCKKLGILLALNIL